MLKISVVTAVFNRERTIANAIESVARQDYENIEHVIQDGGSTDATLLEIKRVARQDVRLHSERDSGIYDGINKGIKRANGDVIGLMHSDDFFASRRIISHVAEALKNPDVDGVYGDLDYVSEDDTNLVIRKWRSGQYERKRLAYGWMPPHPTLYLRREVFDLWGFYDTSFKISADYDAMLRFLIKGGVNLTYVPEVFVKMRVGGASNSSMRKIAQKSIEDYRAIKRNSVGGLKTLACKNFSKLGQFF